jgi:hypothetical protein
MKLFGSKKRLPTPPPYTFDGFRLSHNLIAGLGLPGWNEGRRVYTDAEDAAVYKAMSDFQRDAIEHYGEEARFKPDVISELRTRLGAQALHDLASVNWKNSFDKARIWKACVSTYLKAWADNLNPWILIEVAEILVSQGYKSEAKRVLNVLAQFPDYAKIQESYGFFTEEWVSKLQQRIKEISKDAYL